MFFFFLYAVVNIEYSFALDVKNLLVITFEFVLEFLYQICIVWWCARGRGRDRMKFQKLFREVVNS